MLTGKSTKSTTLMGAQMLTTENGVALKQIQSNGHRPYTNTCNAYYISKPKCNDACLNGGITISF